MGGHDYAKYVSSALPFIGEFLLFFIIKKKHYFWIGEIVVHYHLLENLVVFFIIKKKHYFWIGEIVVQMAQAFLHEQAESVYPQNRFHQ